MKLVAWFTLACFAPLALAAQDRPVAPRKEPPKPAETRFEVWRAVKSLDAALATQTPNADGAKHATLQRTLDAALRRWWLGRGPADLAKLAELTRSLRATPEPAAETVARSLKVTPNPVVVVQGGAAQKLVVESSFPVGWEGPQSLELVVRATSPSGVQLESSSFRVDPAEKLAVRAEVEFPAAAKDEPGKPTLAGVWTLELVARADGAAPAPAGVAWIVPQSLDRVREENAAKLAKLAEQVAARTNTSLSSALTTLNARNALLTDRPDPDSAARFTLDPVAHEAELEREMAALANGIDPYKLRPGDLWRLVPAKVGGQPLAARVFAPSAVKKGEPLPVVFAMGTFGSDECTLLDLSAPRLRALAEEKGFVVASIGISADALNERRFDALYNELADDFPIDGKRVYFLGHGAGASQLGALLAQRGERIAAFATLGSADVKFTPGRHTPTLIVAGSADEVDSPEQLERASATLRKSSNAVALQRVDGPGWWRLPEESVDLAVNWLLERRLP
ncbi:MAG: hypothetical protein L6Q99_09510 [Planctomycetes bacterium]|nr:hypothetical protein [Planctomycetota bacterium]